MFKGFGKTRPSRVCWLCMDARPQARFSLRWPRRIMRVSWRMGGRKHLPLLRTK